MGGASGDDHSSFSFALKSLSSRCSACDTPPRLKKMSGITLKGMGKVSAVAGSDALTTRKVNFVTLPPLRSSST